MRASLPFQSEWFASRWERLLADHPDVAEGSSCAHMNWETVDPERWIPRGYAVVRVDSPGAGRSPGRLHLLSRREIRTSMALSSGRQPALPTDARVRR